MGIFNRFFGKKKEKQPHVNKEIDKIEDEVKRENAPSDTIEQINNTNILKEHLYDDFYKLREFEFIKFTTY